MKLALAAAAVVIAIPAIIGGVGTGIVNVVSDELFGVDIDLPNLDALKDIPSDYLANYIMASRVCPGLGWSIPAAIGKIETDHGRSNLPGVHSGENSAGAGGPMQFLLPTFNGVVARHQLPAGGANPPSRYNPHDAIFAAAYMLCDNGVARGDLHAAIFSYNHAEWYVAAVITQAQTYALLGHDRGSGPSAAAQQAIAYATGQLGLPYEWGGDGPGAGDAGFDCSGLTHAAYFSAGINLPRTADAQYRAGPHLPDDQPLQPGDLVFYGTQAHIHHVGLYIGGGQMINAPTFGKPVQIAPVRYQKDDYTGATRPAK